MYALFPPYLRDVLIPPEDAVRLCWAQAPGLTIGMYIGDDAVPRESTYWVAFATSVERLDDAERIFLGSTRGFSRLRRDHPLFKLTDDADLQAHDLRRVLASVSPGWVSRAEEIRDAATLVMTSYIDPTTSREESEEAASRMERLGVIDRGY